MDSGSLALHTARSLEELEPLADAWAALARHPWNDPRSFRARLLDSGGKLEPHVTSFCAGGRALGLVLATLGDERIDLRIGPKSVWRSRARILRVGTGAVLGECPAGAARALVDRHLELLAAGEADALYLHQSEADSALLQALQASGGFLRRDPCPRQSRGWILEVPDTYEQYRRSRSKSVRSNLNYYANRIQRELGPGLRLVTLSRPDEFESLVRDCEAIASRTYHRGLGLGFGDTPEIRARLAQDLSRGWLRGYLLHHGERPIAFWLGQLYRGTFFTRETGFDPDYSALRPGNYLLSRIIEMHCEERLSRCIDFGVMDAEYKRIFGTRPYEVVSAYAFAPSPRGRALCLARMLFGTTERVARAILGRARARRLSRASKPALP